MTVLVDGVPCLTVREAEALRQRDIERTRRYTEALRRLPPGITIDSVIRIGVLAGCTWFARDGLLLCHCSDPQSDDCPSDVGMHIPLTLGRILQLWGAADDHSEAGA